MKPNKDYPVLFDVDGVIADFVGLTVDFVNSQFKTNYRADEVSCDIRKYMKEWDETCERYVCTDGFATYLKMHDNAQELIKSVEDEYELMFVTSPYKDSKTWSYDRQKWLEKHFKADRDKVIFCHNKRYVRGATLVDDLGKNCIAWSETQGRKSILVDRPWNQTEDTPKDMVIRVKYENLKEAVDEILNETIF